MDIDSAIGASRKMIASPKVNAGFKEYHRKRLEELLAAKKRGVKIITIGKKI